MVMPTVRKARMNATVEVSTIKRGGFGEILSQPLVLSIRRGYSPNFSECHSINVGWGWVWGRAPAGSAPQAIFFFEDRLCYHANSMNFKTEIFTYVKLLINIKFVFF